MSLSKAYPQSENPVSGNTLGKASHKKVDFSAIPQGAIVRTEAESALKSFGISESSLKKSLEQHLKRISDEPFSFIMIKIPHKNIQYGI